ncbi:hypothetical protein EV126DRAFT_415098 [Verticillium dahliae]|nr:hypothetical protein EV126DRAFT_415098 [Verticillium dahliae]
MRIPQARPSCPMHSILDFSGVLRAVSAWCTRGSGDEVPLLSLLRRSQPLTIDAFPCSAFVGALEHNGCNGLASSHLSGRVVSQADQGSAEQRSTSASTSIEYAFARSGLRGCEARLLPCFGISVTKRLSAPRAVPKPRLGRCPFSESARHAGSAAGVGDAMQTWPRHVLPVPMDNNVSPSGTALVSRAGRAVAVAGIGVEEYVQCCRYLALPCSLWSVQWKGAALAEVMVRR